MRGLPQQQRERCQRGHLRLPRRLLDDRRRGYPLLHRYGAVQVALHLVQNGAKAHLWTHPWACVYPSLLFLHLSVPGQHVQRRWLRVVHGLPAEQHERRRVVDMRLQPGIQHHRRRHDPRLHRYPSWSRAERASVPTRPHTLLARVPSLLPLSAPSYAACAAGTYSALGVECIRTSSTGAPVLAAPPLLMRTRVSPPAPLSTRSRARTHAHAHKYSLPGRKLQRRRREHMPVLPRGELERGRVEHLRLQRRLRELWDGSNARLLP